MDTNKPYQTITIFSPTKLDPDSPAYEKYRKSKKFDPKRSSVLMVLQESLYSQNLQTCIVSNISFFTAIFAWLFVYFYTTLLHLPPLKFSVCQSKLGLNPGLLHWQSDALYRWPRSHSHNLVWLWIPNYLEIFRLNNMT